MYDTMEEEGDGASTDLMHEVHQQFLCYMEKSNKRFQKLEELVDLAVQKMSLLRSIQAKQQKEGFVTPAGWKANVRQDRIVQQPGVIPDSGHHVELRLPKYEEGAKIFAHSHDFEHQPVVCGIRNKTGEWPNRIEEENVEWEGELPGAHQNREVFTDPAQAVWESYSGKPIYDEDPSEGMECGPEHELILAALGGNHLHSTIFLQPEFCTSESLEELDIQDSPQRKVPPEDNMPGNNFSEKLEKKGLSPFINENGIYHRVENPYEMGMLTNEVVYELQPMLMAADASSLELNDFSSLVHCSFSEPKGVEVGRPYNMELMSKAKHTHGGKLNCKGVDFFEAVCKINSKDSSTATHSYGLDRSYIKFEEQNSKGNFTDAKGLECTSALKSDDNEGLEVPMELESPKPKDLPATIMQGEEWRWQQPIPYSHFYCLDKKSCKFSREEVLIFDPGGSMQDSWSKSVMKLVINQQKDSQQDCLLRMTTENPVKSLVNSSNKVLENGGEPRFADFKSDYQGGGEQEAVKEESFIIFTMEKASWRGGHSSDHSKGHCPNLHSRKTVIYIFDPGGKKLEGARATMRTWLIFKRGGLSGTAPD